MTEISRADRNIEWIETHCRVPEGSKAGQPVKLEDFQKEAIRAIYDNPNGTRRAIISFARKNGKTALSAFLLLLHLAGPEYVLNGSLYSTARSRDQAAVLYNLAWKCVLLSPTLSTVVKARETKKQLYVPQIGTQYTALSKDSKTALGLSPVFTVHDELGQVRGPRDSLYEALETASGAQESPLSIIISTQAATDSDLLSLIIDDAQTGADPRVVARVWAAGDDLDPFSDEALMAANPAFGVFQNAEETRGSAQDAKRMPSREAEFRNLILNQRIEVNSPFISRKVWEECKGTVADWRGQKLYAGLDLSETTDLTAFVSIYQPDDSGKWHVHPIFWLPAEGLAEKARTDRVPYDLWAKQGFLETIPGRTIDYDFVAQKIRDMNQECDFEKIAFDRYNFRHFKGSLEKSGYDDRTIENTFEPFGQGFISISPAIRSLETMILNGTLVHNNNPLLNMCLANATILKDSTGNRKFVKGKTNARIDGAVSLAMSVGILGDAGEKKKPSYLATDDLLIL